MKSREKIVGLPPLSELSEDQLFGSKVKITAKETLANRSTKTVKQDAYLYRWLEVVGATDPELSTGKTAAFHEKLNGGLGQIVKEKKVGLHLPVSVPTTFKGEKAEFQYGGENRGIEIAKWLYEGDLSQKTQGSFSIKAGDFDIGKLLAQAKPPTQNGIVIWQNRHITVSNPGAPNDGLTTSYYAFGYHFIGTLPIPAVVYSRNNQVLGWSIDPKDFNNPPSINSQTGRVISDVTQARIEYTNITAPREATPKVWGGLHATDNAGHIVAHTLGGSPSLSYNFFAQTESINKGEFRNFETALKEKLSLLKQSSPPGFNPYYDYQLSLIHDGKSPIESQYIFRPKDIKATAIFSDGTSIVDEAFSNGAKARSNPRRTVAYFLSKIR